MISEQWRERERDIDRRVVGRGMEIVPADKKERNTDEGRHSQQKCV